MVSRRKERKIRLVTTQTMGSTGIRHGDVIHASAISGANVLRDMREAITNTLGGKMRRYERLVDATIERALDHLEEAAIEHGYDAVVDVRLSHPVITDGAIEIVATGTGVWVTGE